MRVEQVGGPVQSDGGLARARPALDDEHSPELRPDDPVLLGLDRGHDVAHAAGPLTGEGREEGSLALQRVSLLDEEFGIEDLVVDAGDRASLGDEVTPRPCAERRRRGGLVERGGLGHTPVEEDGFQLFIAQPDATDVPERRAIV